MYYYYYVYNVNKINRVKYDIDYNNLKIQQLNERKFNDEIHLNGKVDEVVKIDAEDEKKRVEDEKKPK